MVLRSSDRPTGAVDTIADHAKQIAALRRQVGRGVSALRDSSGNVLLMNPDSRYPLLTAEAADSAVAFTADGVVKIMSPDTAEDRDMTVRDISSSGNVQANNFHATGGAYFTQALTADHIIAGNGADLGAGPLHAGLATLAGIAMAGDIDATNNRVYANNLAVTGNSIWSSSRDGAVRWESATTGGDGAFSVCSRDGLSGRGVYATNFAPWGSSWRSLKTDHQPVTEYLGHSALEEVCGLDIAAWRYRDDVPGSDGDSRTRIGLHLDELHPRLRIERVSEDGTDQSSWDTVEMLNVALAAIQDQQHEITELRQRVADLERDTPSPIA